MAYERRDVDVRRLLRFGAGLLAAAVVIHAVVAAILLGFHRAETAQPAERPPLEPGREPVPGPPLEFRPAAELLAEQEEILGRTGWVDRERGIVHIPIERAMDRLADRLPARLPKGKE